MMFLLQKVTATLVCAFTIMMLFLVVETFRAPKRKLIARNWGPQSMLYLKGRYGRRYVASDNEEECYLNDQNAVLKSYKRSAPLKLPNF
ncbi:spexin prohormone 1-like isoform X1 [Anolis sagrei]|uniref:spexin prohormone 1-like isoform X1 n=1 Tax=Anolis sagrei TaxID=38937 RepID=UPI003520ED5B